MCSGACLQRALDRGFGGTHDCRGNCRKLPHLFAVDAINSSYPGPVGCRQEAKRGALWWLWHYRGGDRASTTATGVFKHRARSDGYPNSERRFWQVHARSDEDLPRKGRPGDSEAERIIETKAVAGTTVE